jgi:phosphoribosylanthranilate isomerase
LESHSTTQQSAKEKRGQLPRTKVCGVTRADDLAFLKAASVEAVGLNLVQSSKRFLSLEMATDLAAQAAELGLVTVAVVMDPPNSQLKSVARAFSWDFIQLHGHESPQLVEACEGIAIIKAVSWSGRADEERLVLDWSNHFGGSAASLKNCRPDGGHQLAGFLLDAYAPGQGGGTGQKARWDLVYPRPTLLENWPIMLAGGLNADNVLAAIQATHCDAVDTASGVEFQPGIKSEQLVHGFAAAARTAFATNLRFEI